MRSTIAIARSLGLAFAFFLVSVPHAQQAPAPTQKQATETGPVNLTAKSANIGESGIPVKISILRWSTEEERKPVVAPVDEEVVAEGVVIKARQQGWIRTILRWQTWLVRRRAVVEAAAVAAMPSLS